MNQVKVDNSAVNPTDGVSEAFATKIYARESIRSVGRMLFQLERTVLRCFPYCRVP